jgi:hypothetical protein
MEKIKIFLFKINKNKKISLNFLFFIVKNYQKIINFLFVLKSLKNKQC